MAMPVLPPPAVHPVGTHPTVHGQHYVYMSTTPPQSVAVPYTQAGQTPIKLETSLTPPMPTTPQMTLKTPKSVKMNSDSEKDEQEHVSSKHSKIHSKDSKDHESDKEHDVLDNVSEEQETIYFKITRDHLNLPEVQKLLGYSTGPEKKTDKEADITNVIQVPDQPQPQQQTTQQTIQQTVQMVSQDQSQPVMVTPVAQLPQVSQMQLQQQQVIPGPAPVQQVPVQVAVAVPQQLQLQNQNFMASVLQFYSHEEVVDTRLLKFGNTTQVI